MFFSYFSCFDQNKSCNNLMLLCILYVAGKYNSCCFLTFFSLTKTTAATIRCYAGAGYENTLSACKFQFFLQKKYLCYTSCFIYSSLHMRNHETLKSRNCQQGEFTFQHYAIWEQRFLFCSSALLNRDGSWSNRREPSVV